MAQPATPWLSDRAVDLQLQEVNMNIGVLNPTPDPSPARRLVVWLNFFRAEPRVKSALEDELTAYRNKLNYTPFIAWLTSLKFQIEDDPSAFPFALNEKEFAYYAQQNFGGQISDIQEIYKPPSFYAAFAQDVAVVFVGSAVAIALPALIPLWAGAGEVAATGVSFARTAAGTAAGYGLAHVLPGGSWDAAKKDRLWKRYSLDFERRSLK